ncbi:Cysteine desulfurase [Candidatus Norongarragalina meridionalis]|nr:Cysteine desulfurase [Candidatus Norongarragalina meridionalis]
MISEKIRDDFPIFKKRKFIYFDNACTTLKPQCVIDAVVRYYSEYSGCAGRSMHRLGKEAEAAFEKSREEIAGFVGAKKEEVVFTKNCSEALNLVAHSLDFSKKRGVVTSVLEHHSAFLPFQALAQSGKIKLEVVYPEKETGLFDADAWVKKMSRDTRLVVIHHTNNTFGTQPPLKEIIGAAHDSGALVLLDAAQGVPHSEINFKKLGADFMAFSGHKMLGPTGIGCLVGRSSLLEEMPPFLVGGETIESVSLEKTVYAKPPHKFEAGIQNYAGAIGLAEACRYLRKQGMQDVEKHEKEMFAYALQKTEGIPHLDVYGTRDASKRSGIFLFNIRGVSPHQVAIMSDSMKAICMRSGVFCAEPGMKFLGIPDGACRASFYLYNTKREIDVFAETLASIAKLGR